MGYTERPSADIKVIGSNSEIYKGEDVTYGKIVRENEYESGKFQTVKFYDLSGNLVMKSELQIINGVALYRTETHYNSKGVVTRTITFYRIYDSSGNLISEEINNA